ncbi:MAG: hypothetical protein N3A68_05315 [Bacteroidia bacterium]|jgi:hypothetical protein|nr:hypothetical protein [Bacteroidia bacterium]GIV23935.1 MAG: hypothetical protein KatS3mg025_1594 [Bacteroidia bacterium]
MNEVMTRRAYIMLSVFGIATAFAQFPPRVDDHFWRKKVVLTIDLREKVNEPIEAGQAGYRLYTNYSTDPITDKSPYANREGMIVALLKGFKDGKFVGYSPKNLSQQVSFEEFDARSRRIESGGEAAGGEGGDEMGGGDFGGDEFGGDDLGGDEFGGEDLGGGIDAAPTSDATVTPKAEQGFPYLKYYRTKIQIVEDRIFDKNRSDMYYDMQYLCLIQVDPKGALPDEPAVCFRYKDVMDVMDDTQWRNRSNDAEDRSMREIIELRRFNGYVTIVSGEESRTLNEAERRRQQMIEFEHNLWTF